MTPDEARVVSLVASEHRPVYPANEFVFLGSTVPVACTCGVRRPPGSGPLWHHRHASEEVRDRVTWFLSDANVYPPPLWARVRRWFRRVVSRG